MTTDAVARTVATYHQSIGGAATLDAYLTAAAAQSRATWSANLMAKAVATYLKAGYP